MPSNVIYCSYWGGHWGWRFWPFFASVFRSYRFLSSVLRFSTALGFVVVSLYRSPFTVCRCCSRFFGSFITHTLYAALERYTDIVVLVFNDFGHGFAVFGNFCCSFAVFTTPQCPPPYCSMVHTDWWSKTPGIFQGSWFVFPEPKPWFSFMVETIIVFSTLNHIHTTSKQCNQ